MVVVYAIAILGLAILTGFNGQISLGHGAFYAIGAYTTADPDDEYGTCPYWATLPVSAVVCAAVGFLIGLPALRLGGLYLALTTFALAVAVPQILKHNALERLDRRRAGAGDRQAGPAVRPAICRRTSGCICSRWSSARCCSCWRGTSCAGASAAR